MFTAQVYKIAVLSLSGIMDEVYAAQEIIRKYNQENAEKMGKLFLPLEGNTTASDADVVIGIVGNYIEKVEVIGQAVKDGKKVLLFFSKYQDPENTIPAEGRAVAAFMREVDTKCVYSEYISKADFEELLATQLRNIDN